MRWRLWGLWGESRSRKICGGFGGMWDAERVALGDNSVRYAAWLSETRRVSGFSWCARSGNGISHPSSKAGGAAVEFPGVAVPAVCRGGVERQGCQRIYFDTDEPSPDMVAALGFAEEEENDF